MNKYKKTKPMFLDTKGICIIAGYSGSGKSLLMRKICKEILENRQHKIAFVCSNIFIDLY